MKLFPESADGEAIQGPFLVDIDSRDWAHQSLHDLDDTLRIARQVVSSMTNSWHLTPKRDLRIFFGGRKGFNIEAIPDSLGIRGDMDQQIRASADCLDSIIRELQDQNSIQPGNGSTVSAHGTSIDRTYGNRFGYRLRHPYIRLHDSWNCWESGGTQTCRRRTRLTTEELVELPVEGIIELSERT